MTYIIAEPCIDVKDGSCVEVCPVDCIYEGEDQFYIHPDECIDCGACEPECPVQAIFPGHRRAPGVDQLHREERGVRIPVIPPGSPERDKKQARRGGQLPSVALALRTASATAPGTGSAATARTYPQ